MATRNDPKTNLLSLTDCLYFTNGSCTFKSKCRYRHCQTAIKQLEKCPNWPESCRDMNCPFRHTATPFKAPKTSTQQKGLVAFFWDYENVPIPRGQRPFDIVQRIRQKLVIEPGLQEVDFSCYCNIDKISKENQQSLQHATVSLIHVPDQKANGADRQIMLHLDRFERIHRPPATIVLISGDIDFIGKLSDLRHQAGFHVIVIHNKPAKEELKATVNEHYPWEFFTESPAQPQPLLRPNIINSSERLPKPPSNPRPVLNDGLNKNRNGTVQAPEKPKQPLIRSLLDIHVENILPDTNPPQSTRSTPQEPPKIVPRRRRSPDHTKTIEPLIASSSNETPISNIGNNTPSTISTATVAPRFRLRHGISTNELNKQNIPTFGSSEQIPSTVDNNTTKIPPTMLQCPYCTNEYSTTQALRQHQKDKNHLFDCPVCKAGFPTAIGLKQHQSSKGHSATNDTDDHCDVDLERAINLNLQELKLEHNQKSLVKNKRLPVHQNPVANYATNNGDIYNNNN
jgi:hypothetical protein